MQRIYVLGKKTRGLVKKSRHRIQKQITKEKYRVRIESSSQKNDGRNR